MSTAIEALVPELQWPARALIDLATRAGVGPRITSTLRSHSEQARLYRRYLSGQTPYPVAPPGSSAHEYGLAFDLVVVGEQNQTDLGSVWQSWGGIYGGGRDPVHFELPGFTPRPSIEVLGGGAVFGTPEPCGPWDKAIAEAVDLAVGFVPGVAEVELVAWLLSLGFPNSALLQWFSNPVTQTLCR